MTLKNSISILLVTVLLIFAGIQAACTDDPEIPVIKIKSAAFEQEKPIPAKYTCEGEDISPDLEWSEIPEETMELALVCDDPDAPGGTWVHWVVYGIPADTGGLAESFPAVEQTEAGVLQGKNSWRKIGYGGPCPPPGKPHRYLFKIYALDKKLGLKPGAIKRTLEDAMKDHIIGYGELMGTYGR